jgi:hypothetical protein
MTTGNVKKNRALLRFILLPIIFLTVCLLGGWRVAASTDAASSSVFQFIAPPLITLVLAALLMLLFVRGHLLDLRRWFSNDHAPLVNLSHALTLLTLFFASAQAFNSVLPERGILYWLFSFFFLWTLWTNLFSIFDARRLLRSLVALFVTAFALKHLLFAGLYNPEGSWLKRLTSALLEGVSIDSQTFAPATGYISFAAIALYVVGLMLLLASALESGATVDAQQLINAYQDLEPADRRFVRKIITAQTIEPTAATKLIENSLTTNREEESIK